MKKQVLLGLCAASLMSNSAFAANGSKLSNRFFVKNKISIGFDATTYDNYKLNSGFPTKNGFLVEDSFEKKVNYAPIISFGSNLYFDLSNIFKPFIGFEAQGRLPVFGNDFEDKASWLSVPSLKEKKYSEIQFNEYFRLNAKLGSRINIGKNFAVEPYALGGINLMRIGYDTEYRLATGGVESASYKQIRPGLTCGAGMDVVIGGRFTVGFEYRYGMVTLDNKYSNLVNQIGKDGKLKTHSFVFKTGIEF